MLLPLCKPQIPCVKLSRQDTEGAQHLQSLAPRRAVSRPGLPHGGYREGLCHLSGSSCLSLRELVSEVSCAAPSSHPELIHPQPQLPAPQSPVFGLNTKEREQ